MLFSSIRASAMASPSALAITGFKSTSAISPSDECRARHTKSACPNDVSKSKVPDVYRFFVKIFPARRSKRLIELSRIHLFGCIFHQRRVAQDGMDEFSVGGRQEKSGHKGQMNGQQHSHGGGFAKDQQRQAA